MPASLSENPVFHVASDRDDDGLWRARFAHAQRIAGFGCWEWDPQTNAFWWSSEVCRMLGQEKGRIEPSRAAFLTVVHADDREAVDACFQEVLANCHRLDIEYRIIRPDGRLRYIRTQGELASLGPGRPTVMLGTIQDITEQRETENRLRLLKEAVECLPVGITITGVDGKIVYTNPAEAQIHGYTVDELLNGEARVLAPQRLRIPMPLEQLEKIGLWRRETVNLRKCGEEFPVQLTSVAVRTREGRFLGVVTACEDITERKANEQRIVELAYNDTLTGLPNRWMFQDRLGKALAAAGRDGHRVGVMFLDLDHFKDVNDTLGHEFGDKLLRAVAQRLAGSTREADTLARLGGDEFIVILTHLDGLDGVAAVAERIQASFRQPFELEGREIYSGASIGIAIYPEDGKDVASLLQSADVAMYHAKGQGRQTYHFYSRAMNQSIRRKIALENGLRRALAQQEFYLVFQPQWDLCSGKVIGLEALIRWDSEEFGSIPPASFIPLAENSGLIFAIGEWVLRRACSQVASWLADGYVVPRVSVNISGQQIKRPDFLAMVDAVLAETALPAQSLELEFTESVLMEDAGRTIALLRELKNRGIHLSIDDFGTGYSSLSYLRHFPIDRIKIDRAFIADMSSMHEESALVEAIIAMGRSLKLQVLAEGVESCAQLEFLTRRGCHEAQGFLLAKPLKVEELTALLIAGRLLPLGGTVCAGSDAGMLSEERTGCG